jgi:hypothetical protein
LADPAKLLGVVVGQPGVAGVVRVEPVVQHGGDPLEPPGVARLGPRQSAATRSRSRILTTGMVAGEPPTDG